MKRIRIVLPFVVCLGLLFVLTMALSGAPALARSNAQATVTPTPAPETNARDQIFVTLVPGTAGPSQLVVLTLKADGQAEMLTDPLGDEPPVTQVGTWSSKGDSVTLTLTGTTERAFDQPATLVFKQGAEQLVATDLDTSVYGANGLTLYLRDAVEAKIAGWKRAYVTLDLAAGFPLDPFLVSVNGGGELDAGILGENCHGYIDVNPTVTVRWSGRADLVRAFTYSDADPVLVVQTPDGKILCGDDASKLALDSQVEIANPSAGTYNIWVGSAQPKQLLPTILVLTAQSGVDLDNFRLDTLVKREPLPDSEGALPHAVQANTITDAIARFKGAVGELLGDTPLTQQVSGEGDIAAFDIDFGDAICNGFIADTPDYVFDVSSDMDQFTVFFESKQDASLLVVGPDGTVGCNDDSIQAANTNPSVTFEKPKQGRYAVFVGRINQDAAVEGTLTVTTAPKAEPQVLPPSQ